MPHLTPIPDLLTRLGTDATTGLSPKEAAKRRESSTASPLFRQRPRRYADCVKQTVREPAFWMLVFVAFISLFFDRVALGLFCLLLSAGHMALNACFLWRADHTDFAMAVYDAPLCRVLRGRRLLRIPADEVVPGDILRIHSGDIIPADCRLLTTEGFAVLERELDASNPRRAPVRLEKDADGYAEAGDGLRLSPVNMVYAGGMAESGSALAVAVAVGSETHLGGLIGHVPSPHRGRSVGYFKKAAGILSVYNLCLLCLSVPLTALGIFTVGESYEFLDIFLSALALSAVTLTEAMLARGVCLADSARRAAARDRDGANTAEIKSAATPEALTAMTDLLLVGTAALHDGESHPESLRIGDRVYRCDRPDADGEARAVAEYLCIYREGMSALPVSGVDSDRRFSLLTAFCEWAELDVDALRVKASEIRPRGRGVSAILPATLGNRRVTVVLTERFDEVEACTLIYDREILRPLDSEGKNALYRAYREAVRQGSIPLFVLTETDREQAVRAMLTYAPCVCRKTAGCIRNLEQGGIRVAAFLREESDSHLRALETCGLTDRAPADRPAPAGYDRIPAARRMDEGCRAFVGCSEEDIRACLADLKAEGRTVGVLSGDARDVALLAEADIAFTCAPSLYEASWSVRSTADADVDGSPDDRVANDRARRAAHVVVRRSSETGGGVLGVLRAVQAADAFRSGLDHTIRFVLLSQIIRAVMTILPLCFGMAIAAAPTLLLSGLVVDLLVMTAAAGLAIRPTVAPRRKAEETIARPLTAYLPEIVASVVGAALPWGVAGIARLCGAEPVGDLLYYGLLCTLILQVAVFRTDSLPRRSSVVFMATLALGLVWVGALATALVGGLRPLWALVLPLSTLAGYLPVYAIGRAVAKRKK